MEKYKTIQQLEAEMNVSSNKDKSLSEQVYGAYLRELIKNSAKKNKTEEIKNLISSTPNDQELGEKIREMFR